jgi:hypothetical protein
MSLPKNKTWHSLSDLKSYVEKKEKIVYFDGWQLITKTTRYTMANGTVRISKPEDKL